MAKPSKKKTTKKATKPTVAPVVEKPVVEKPVVEKPVAKEPNPEQDGAQLTIADLQAIAQVIDMACRRGAFGAGEARDVGIIYDKLASFLQVISDQKKATEEGGQ